MSEPSLAAPDERLKMVLAPSDGATPAGTLALIHALASQLAQQTGAALPATAAPCRPEAPGDPSGTVIAAQVLTAHAVDQSEAQNLSRAAARDQLVATGDAAALAAMNAEAIQELRAVLAELAAAGYAAQFELQLAGVRATANG